MDGILLFNKPILWTSHDAVDFIRRRLNQSRVGHAGTLDPMATGLLVVLVGKATKLSGVLTDFDKDYYGVMTVGVATDSQDLEGRIVSKSAALPVTDDVMDRIFAELTGPQRQKPPMYSAAKTGGKKMYQWARSGVNMPIQEKDITVHRFSRIRSEWPDIHFFLTCSKGTYVRVLAEDAGKRLGEATVLSALVRLRVGPFFLESAWTQETLTKKPLEQIERELLSYEDFCRTPR